MKDTRKWGVKNSRYLLYVMHFVHRLQVMHFVHSSKLRVVVLLESRS